MIALATGALEQRGAKAHRSVAGALQKVKVLWALLRVSQSRLPQFTPFYLTLPSHLPPPSKYRSTLSQYPLIHPHQHRSFPNAFTCIQQLLRRVNLACPMAALAMTLGEINEGPKKVFPLFQRPLSKILCLL